MPVRTSRVSGRLQSPDVRCQGGQQRGWDERHDESRKRPHDPSTGVQVRGSTERGGVIDDALLRDEVPRRSRFDGTDRAID